MNGWQLLFWFLRTWFLERAELAAGAMVQVFLLAHGLTRDAWSGNSPKKSA
jgi:hypothetical protein